MKSRENLLRLRQFEVEEKRQKIADLERMIEDFKGMADDLDRQIAAEEEAAGISDPSHFSYPPFAKAARERRDNLRRSADELESQLVDVRKELEEALEELDKVAALGERQEGADGGMQPSSGGLREHLSRQSTRGR